MALLEPFSDFALSVWRRRGVGPLRCLAFLAVGGCEGAPASDRGKL